jgi:hypothetical protein
MSGPQLCDVVGDDDDDGDDGSCDVSVVLESARLMHRLSGAPPRPSRRPDELGCKKRVAKVSWRGCRRRGHT